MVWHAHKTVLWQNVHHYVHIWIFNNLNKWLKVLMFIYLPVGIQEKKIRHKNCGNPVAIICTFLTWSLLRQTINYIGLTYATFFYLHNTQFVQTHLTNSVYLSKSHKRTFLLSSCCFLYVVSSSLTKREFSS